MNPWLWFPAAAVFVTVVFAGVNDVCRRVSDRRWRRIVRDGDRRRLRYATWQAVSRLGGEK